MNNIWIYGAGGMGKETLWLINDCLNDYNVKGFVDDFKQSTDFEELPVVQETNIADNYVIAIANTKQRKEIAIVNQKLNFANVVHPSVKINPSVKVGIGNIFCLGTIFTRNIKVGSHIIVNVNTIIGHDTIIESYVSIMFGVKVSGNVTIGEGTYIGSGAVILPNIKIGRWCKVGAGAVVTKDIPDGKTYVGIPATEIKYNGE